MLQGRWTRSALFLALVAVSVLGCEKKKEQAAQKSITFDFWTTEVQSDRQEIIEQLALTFEALNPGVDVKVVPVREEDLVTQLTVAIESGSGLPAVVNGASDVPAALSLTGAIDIPLTNRVLQTIGKERFYEGALRLVQAPATEKEKGYYAVPFYGWVQGIWYRGDWFDEAGLEPPNTWERILKAAKYFHRPQENRYGILIGTNTSPYTEQVFAMLALSRGVRLFDAAGQLKFDSPGMRETVEFYKELANYTPPGPQTWRGRDYYLQGRLAMFFYSTFIMDDLAILDVAEDSLSGENFEDLAGADFDPDLAGHTRVVSTITKTVPGGYGRLVTLFFPKGNEPAVQEVAVKFSKMLFEKSPYITWVHMAPGGMIPPLKKISADPAFLQDPKGIFSKYGPERVGQILEGFENLGSLSLVEGRLIPAMGFVTAKQIISRMLFSIIQEGKSVDEGLAWAKKSIESLIAEQS